MKNEAAREAERKEERAEEGKEERQEETQAQHSRKGDPIDAAFAKTRVQRRPSSKAG